MNPTRRGFLAAAGDMAEARDKEHDHDHGHDHQVVPSDLTLRVKALESLMVEKGLVDRAALDALVDTFEHKVGPRNGARVVAKAWASTFPLRVPQVMLRVNVPQRFAASQQVRVRNTHPSGHTRLGRGDLFARFHLSGSVGGLP